MSNNFRYTIALLFLASVIISSIDWEVPDFFESIDKSSTDTVSLYLEDSTSYNFDEKGDLHSSMTSPIIVQYDKNNTLHAQKPKFEISQKNALWYISSDDVFFDDKGDYFELLKNIEIKQPQQTIISTHKLIIDNKRKVAHTDSSVEIKTPYSTTTAEGLHANLDNQQITLKKVKTVYAPVKKP